MIRKVPKEIAILRKELRLEREKINSLLSQLNGLYSLVSEICIKMEDIERRLNNG